jgi:FkbM family methyltransferase
MITWAQNFEDIYIRKFYDNFANQYVDSDKFMNFIDIGAWEPVLDSVSKHFIDSGWSGLLIDANPEIVKKIKNEYLGNKNISVLNFAVTNSNQKYVSLFVPKNTTGWASLNVGHVESLSEDYSCIKVQAIGLDDLILSYNKFIFFVKIDAETYEENIIQPHVNNGQVVLFVLEKVSDKIIDLMKKKNYDYKFNDGLNGYFVNNNFDKVKSPLPINVIEDANWVPAKKHFLAASLVSEYNLKIEELKEQIVKLNFENVKLELNLNQVTNSLSMKVTLPLRKLKNLFRK